MPTGDSLRLAVTLGDPRGVGPEVSVAAVRALRHSRHHLHVTFVGPEGTGAEAAADFERRGVMLQEEVRVPFPKIDLTINAKIKGSDEQIAKLKADLAKFCPISMVIRESGTEINEIWNIERL